MKTNLITVRKLYQKKIMRLLDNDNVIFALGVRRAGKICIAAQIYEQIKRRYADDGKVYFVNTEVGPRDDLYAEHAIEWFDSIYDPEKRIVLIVDEVNKFKDWERAANYSLKYPNVKLILFASNRRVLSEKLDAFREGRYDVVEMLPLSFGEYVYFCGLREIPSAARLQPDRMYADADDNQYTVDQVYDMFLSGRAMPSLERDLKDDASMMIESDGMFSSILVHDILEASSSMGLSTITDHELLNSIVTVLVKSMGNNVSATWVGKQTPDYIGRPSSTKTVESYIKALVNSHLFYMVDRFDIKAEQKLKTLSKYYIVDMSLYRFIAGGLPEDRGVMLENRVYFELLRRGYQVFNGKYGEEEVKFMTTDGHDRVYVQTADLFRERERRILLSPLRKIKDNHPKVIIANNSETRTTVDGILILNAQEFFMGASWGRQRQGY